MRLRVPTAWRSADAIAARLTGRKVPSAPLRYVDQCLSLGRGDGLVQPASEARTPLLLREIAVPAARRVIDCGRTQPR
ncbi:hypothetical protein GCM10023237_68510 [Streptomyces coeruleoprunus]